MRTSYNDLTISFSMEYLNFYAIHFAYERFLRSIPSHSHSDNSVEIHYIPYGRGKVKMNQTLYHIEPNTLYITGPHIEHEQIPDKEDPMVEYCVYLKFEYKKNYGKKDLLNSYLQLFENTRLWFGQDTQHIYPLMQQIFLELDKQHAGYKNQIESLLQQLIVHCVRNYQHDLFFQNQIESPALMNSKYLIIEEYFLYEYKNLSLEMLADRLALSQRQTERLLRKHYEKTFLQKKTEARMSAASILLLDNGKKITDIALELGYSSVEHFSTAFHRYYNKSPRDYRR